MEAMWIDFEWVSKKRRFTTRPFVEVNAISGEVATRDITSLTSQASSLISQEDYLVVNRQSQDRIVRLSAIAPTNGVAVVTPAPLTQSHRDNTFVRYLSI